MNPQALGWQEFCLRVVLALGVAAFAALVAAAVIRLVLDMMAGLGWLASRLGKRGSGDG